MSTVTTTKIINSNQLAAEVASKFVGVIAISDDGTVRTVTADMPQADLQAAIDAHTAIDERANRATLVDRAATALQANRDFLALASPTNAQTLAQVKALTRQNTALIRLALGRLDSTD